MRPRGWPRHIRLSDEMLSTTWFDKKVPRRTPGKRFVTDAPDRVMSQRRRTTISDQLRPDRPTVCRHRGEYTTTRQAFVRWLRLSSRAHVPVLNTRDHGRR